MRFTLCALLVFVAVAAALPKQGPKVTPALNLKERLAGRQDRIVGGEAASRDEFPYQISYQWEVAGFRQHICGGSILKEGWVLTAAHCVTEVPNLGKFYVVAGILDLNDDVPTRQEILVIKKIVHEKYPGGVAPYDIALLQLETPLVFSTAVQPIPLPEDGSIPLGTSDLSGWGAISAGGIIMPKVLQKVRLPILTYQECADAVAALQEGQIEPLDESNVCTGPLDGGLSACSGDSGGPLALDGVLVGIVSWGWIPCGAVGCPSIYTGVSNYIGWIELTIWVESRLI